MIATGIWMGRPRTRFSLDGIAPRSMLPTEMQ